MQQARDLYSVLTPHQRSTARSGSPLHQLEVVAARFLPVRWDPHWTRSCGGDGALLIARERYRRGDDHPPPSLAILYQDSVVVVAVAVPLDGIRGIAGATNPEQSTPLIR